MYWVFNSDIIFIAVQVSFAVDCDVVRAFHNVERVRHTRWLGLVETVQSIQQTVQRWVVGMRKDCVEWWWLECVAKETAEKAKVGAMFIIVRDAERKDARPPCDEMFWPFDSAVGGDEVGDDEVSGKVHVGGSGGGECGARFGFSGRWWWVVGCFLDHVFFIKDVYICNSKISYRPLLFKKKISCLKNSTWLLTTLRPWLVGASSFSLSFSRT